MLEKAAYLQALNHLVSNNLIDTFQSGFRPAHSTTTALHNVLHDIRLGAYKGLVTVMILFDFTQGFPSTVQDILYQKLRLMGFSETAVNWFRSFLKSYDKVSRLVWKGPHEERSGRV